MAISLGKLAVQHLQLKLHHAGSANESFLSFRQTMAIVVVAKVTTMRANDVPETPHPRGSMVNRTRKRVRSIRDCAAQFARRQLAQPTSAVTSCHLIYGLMFCPRCVQHAGSIPPNDNDTPAKRGFVCVGGRVRFRRERAVAGQIEGYG